MSRDDALPTDGEVEQTRSDREGLEWLLESRGDGSVETAQPGGLPSATSISPVAFDLIVEFEVSSEAVYTRKYRGPVWPGGASGVTIGIGYDVGYADAATLAADFGNVLPPVMINLLRSVIGVTGTAAQGLAQELAGQIDVSWTAAIAVHRTKVVPRWVGVVERALPHTAHIGPDCLGALVSLTYNRGASFSKDGDRYAEMRAIKADMATHRFRDIPAQMRAMKRLWPTVPGLQKRREREARLFEAGLGTV